MALFDNIVQKKKKELKQQHETIKKEEVIVKEEELENIIPENSTSDDDTTEEIEKDYKLVEKNSIILSYNSIDYYNRIYKDDNGFYLSEIFKGKNKLYFDNVKIIKDKYILISNNKEFVLNIKRRNKKSVFNNIDKEDLEYVGQMIFEKKFSYKQGFEKIKEKYKDLSIIQNKSYQSFRTFLLKEGFVPDKNSLKGEYKRTSKQKLNKLKREVILEDLIEDLSNDSEKMEFFLSKIVNSKVFEEAVLRIINKG